MDSTFMNIQSAETKIVGRWVFENGKLVADSAAKRIYQLVDSALVEIARSDDGWSVLYLDQADGRYWELSYPDSEQHGGGPPALCFMSQDDARKKYKASPP